MKFFVVFVWLFFILLCYPGFSQLPELTRGPYLNMGTTSSMVIHWRTDSTLIPVDTRVWYGTVLDTSQMIVIDDPTLTYDHVIHLSSLSATTKYFYAIGTSNHLLHGPDSNLYFKTSPPIGAKELVRIWAIGDFGEGNTGQLAVRDGYKAFLNKRHTDVWLFLGDNAYDDGRDTEYQSYVFDIYPEVFQNTVVWPTPGNHDYGSNYPVISLGADPYFNIFSMPTNAEAGGFPSGNEGYYSFDYGNVHFISLNSEDYVYSIDIINQSIDIDHNPSMVTWLENDLAANTNKDWIIAYWHQPPYSRGTHTETNSAWSYVDGLIMRTMRDEIVPILEAGGVDLVLSGHSHSYERSFYVHGNYGSSSPYAPDSTMVDGSTGSAVAGTPYIKLSSGIHANKGTVYSVVGSSSKTGNLSSDYQLDHPLMCKGAYELGSLVLEVEDNTLTGFFIDTTGNVFDDFSIIKGGTAGHNDDFKASIVNLSIHPNPFTNKIIVSYDQLINAKITINIVNMQGQIVGGVLPNNHNPGKHYLETDTGQLGIKPGNYIIQVKSNHQLLNQWTIKL